MWIKCSNTATCRVLHKQMTHSGMCLTHVSKNTGYCLHVESGIEVRELAAHGKSKRMNTDTSLTCKDKPMVRLYDHNSFLCVRLSLFIVNPYCTRRTRPPAHDPLSCIKLHVLSAPPPLFLTPAAGIEQCSLEAHHSNILQALIDGDVHGVPMVRVDIGQGQQVC